MFCGLFSKKKKATVAPEPNHHRVVSSIEWRIINGVKYMTTRNHFLHEKSESSHTQVMEVGDQTFRVYNSEIRNVSLSV